MSMRELLRGAHARITLGLVVCGIAWGLVNFAFVLWLPINLVSLGIEAKSTSTLLAWSAVLALPGIFVVVWLYHRWSSISSLVLFIALTTLALLAFFVMGLTQVRSAPAIVVATVAC